TGGGTRGPRTRDVASVSPYSLVRAPRIRGAHHRGGCVMRARVFAVAFLALVPTLTAQSERLTIRMAPAPNQTIREQMTIVVAMTTTPRLSSSDSPSVPPEQGEMKTTMDL